MSTIECKMYYAGHGSMVFTEVKNNLDVVEKIIIVDAGSTSDATDPSNKESIVSLNTVLKRIDELQTNIIICITHGHEDHYNFVWEIIMHLNKKSCLALLEKVFIGSIVNRNIADYPVVLQNIVNFPNINVVRLGILYDNHQTLWTAIENDVELLVLYNCVTYSEYTGDVNDRTAAFLIRHTKKKMGIFFTGDSTGTTFNNLKVRSQSRTNLANIFKYYDIYVTAPHHGSFDTMLPYGFIECITSRGRNDYKADLLDEFLDDINLKKIRLMISAGVADIHGHPDMLVTATYLDRCINSIFSGTVPVYETKVSYSGSSTYYDATYIDQHWYSFTYKRSAFTTVHVLKKTVVIENKPKTIYIVEPRNAIITIK